MAVAAMVVVVVVVVMVVVVMVVVVVVAVVVGGGSGGGGGGGGDSDRDGGGRREPYLRASLLFCGSSLFLLPRPIVPPCSAAEPFRSIVLFSPVQVGTFGTVGLPFLLELRMPSRASSVRTSKRGGWYGIMVRYAASSHNSCHFFLREGAIADRDHRFPLFVLPFPVPSLSATALLLPFSPPPWLPSSLRGSVESCNLSFYWRSFKRERPVTPVGG